MLRNTFAITLLALVAALATFGITSCSREGESATSRTLTVWHTELDPQAVAELEAIAESFEASRPGVSVEVQAISWGDLNQKLQAAIVAGEVPDLTHLQPFMTASLVKQGLLRPLEDVFSEVGVDNVYPAVRDLQLFDGKRYGIAYAVGSTFYAVRRDLWEAVGSPEIATWDEYLALVRSMSEDTDGDGTIDRYGVVLPGTPFFIEQFLAELVASNGGRLYDQEGRPQFTSSPVLEALAFFRDLSAEAPPEWTSISYLEQFREFAAGRVASVPVFYARALKNIEQDSPRGQGTPEYYTFLPQPHGPSGTAGFATMDCENWSIFRDAKHPELASEFLKSFYAHDNYVNFCRTVPVHLTPITPSAAADSRYADAPMTSRWRAWQAHTQDILARNRALPILMTHQDDRHVSYLLQLSGEQVMTRMILDVCTNGVSPADAAAAAQQRALEIFNRSR